MDHRIIKYYAGELGADERKALLREAFADPVLKQEMVDYQQCQSLMHLHPRAKNESIGKESLRRFLKARRGEKERRRIAAWCRYAAVAVLCVVSTWWVTYSLVGADVLQPAEQQLTVPSGQRAHITLPDGTKVWVNAGSVLTYPSVFGAERRVRLTGEAFFEVAKQAGAPFVVSASGVDVKALGTRFNVFGYPSEALSVALLDGSVRVYHPGSEQQGVLLRPQQQLTASADGRFHVSPLAYNPIIWKDGLYAFDRQPLRDILKKLELYYDVRFIVQDLSILDYEYTGKFRQRDGVMEVLRIIQKIHPFRFRQQENTNEIILYR